MAGLTKEQRTAKAAAEQNSPKAVDDSHLIAVSKGGEQIKVHPSCLADHKRLGWTEL